MALNLRKRVSVSYCETKELAPHVADCEISEFNMSEHLQRLRKRPKISYYEPEEPNFDEYVYCEDCTDFVFEYCAIHGPLLVIPDDKVPSNPDIPPQVPHAALTIPHVFLHLASSSIPGAGIGVFSTLTLPRGVRFGPYRGQRTNTVDSMYCWQIHSNNKKLSHVIDAANPDRSNWMRYVNCSRHWSEQNLVAYQYKGQLYYRTIKIIPRFTELLVFYGSEFANMLGVNLCKYNSPLYNGVSPTGPPIPNNRAAEIEESSNNISTEHTDSNTSESNEELLNFNDFHIIDENTQDNDLFQNTHVTQPVEVLENTSLDLAENTRTIEVVNDFNNNKNENNFSNLAAKLKQDKIQPNHKSTQTDEIFLGMNQKDRITKNNLEKKFHCEKCEKSFTRKKYLKLHDKRIHQSPKYLCDKCKYGTSIHCEFKRHCLQHAKQTTYCCSECSYKSCIKHNFDRHIRRHLNKSVLKKCSICDYNTYSRWNLYTHKLRHEGIEYKCDYCDYKTNLKIYLGQHIYRIHKKQ